MSQGRKTETKWPNKYKTCGGAPTYKRISAVGPLMAPDYGLGIL